MFYYNVLLNQWNIIKQNQSFLFSMALCRNKSIGKVVVHNYFCVEYYLDIFVCLSIFTAKIENYTVFQWLFPELILIASNFIKEEKIKTMTFNHS